MKKYEWMRTDTASVMFSAINGRNRSRLCRLSVVLKDEEVDPERLGQAVINTMPRFPGFSCRCRKGFFWVFLEKSEKLPRVLPESSFPAALRRLGKYARPELEVLYYKRRISLEGSHVLGDGFGYTEFAKALVAEYLILGGADRELFRGVISAEDSPSAEEYEDSYARFYNASGNRDLPPRPNAYSVKPDILPGYTKLVAGLVPTVALKSKSRELGITITEYLAGVMIRAVTASAPAPIRKKIVISVPVNLRSVFPTHTLRNFLFETNIVFSPGGRSDISPEEIYSAVRDQIKASAEKDVLQAFINRMHGLTHKPHLKIFPYFIKKPVLNFSQKTAHMKKMTAVLSNVGNIKMPEALSQAIERIDAFGGNPSVYGLSMFCSATGLNGFMNITFSLCSHDTNLVREFFSAIVADGVPVRVESSDDNDISPEEKAFPKKCPRCRVEIGEEYGVCPLCGSRPEPAVPEITYFKTALFPSPAPPEHPPAEPRERARRKGFMRAYFDLR